MGLLVLDLAMGSATVFALALWAAEVLCNGGIAAIRFRGYVGTSSILVVGLFFGMIAAVLIREYFGMLRGFSWVSSPWLYAAVPLGEVLFALGEFALWCRVRLFGWPPKEFTPPR